MPALYFKPWIGPDFAEIQRLREQNPIVLTAQRDFWAHPIHVLGESHYGHPDEYRDDFTETVIRKCAFAPSRCGRFFAKILQVVGNRHISELDREHHWHKLAFSNYVQDLLPKSRQQPSNAEWDRGAAAFRTQLAITRPEILLVLGRRLWDHLPRDFGFPLPLLRLPTDVLPLPQSYGDREVVVNEAWAYVYETGGRKRLSIAVYVLHPSGRGFDWCIAARRLNTVRVYYDNIGSGEDFAGWPPAKLD